MTFNDLIEKEDKLRQIVNNFSYEELKVINVENQISKNVDDFYTKITKTILTRLRSLKLSDSTHLDTNDNGEE